MAIDDLLDEHEQSERVLEWLRRNGGGLIGGILLGLAAIGGWKWWQQHETTQQSAAATQYQAAADAIAIKQPGAEDKVKALPQGLYHTLASLQLAKAQVAAGHRAEAIATLRAAKPSEPALAQVVNERLARLLIDAKQAGAALEIIGSATTPTALEVRGDAQFALGQRDRARDTYQQALTKLDVASPHRRLLELKLTEVGGTLAKSEPKS
jgi:predicted negative regulator of RcsB-dependent stress response